MSSSAAGRRRWRRIRSFPGLALLLLAACGGDAEQRRGSIYELQAEPTPANIERIRELLQDPERDVRATALHALIGLGVDDSIELALTGLEDPDGFVRSTAAKLLGELGDSAHAPLLVRVLETDTDPMARQRAAEALGEVGGADALPGLAAGLEDPIQRVRMASVEALRTLDPSYAKDRLLRVLADDPAWEVRAQAARVLGLTGDPAVLDGLQAAAEDPNEFVRSAAANAITVLEEVRARRGEPGPGGV